MLSNEMVLLSPCSTGKKIGKQVNKCRTCGIRPSRTASSRCSFLIVEFEHIMIQWVFPVSRNNNIINNKYNRCISHKCTYTGCLRLLVLVNFYYQNGPLHGKNGEEKLVTMERLFPEGTVQDDGNFHPELLGKMKPFWRLFVFKWVGGLTTNQLNVRVENTKDILI